LNIPLVFDYHHDVLNPSPDLTPSEIIARTNVIFARRGIKPKQHLSEPREGAVTVMERRAHADRCQRLPGALPDDMGASEHF
jgi:UV DNA damage endonuclease